MPWAGKEEHLQMDAKRDVALLKFKRKQGTREEGLYEEGAKGWEPFCMRLYAFL